MRNPCADEPVSARPDHDPCLRPFVGEDLKARDKGDDLRVACDRLVHEAKLVGGATDVRAAALYREKSLTVSRTTSKRWRTDVTRHPASGQRLGRSGVRKGEQRDDQCGQQECTRTESTQCSSPDQALATGQR